MQRVEELRHCAELIERASAEWTEDGREFAADVARQWRQIAEQEYASSQGRALDAITPPRWKPPLASKPDDPAPARLESCVG
jgi:hypothetical protein